MKSFNETIEESMSKAIDENVKESGGINAAILDARIRELEGTLLDRLDRISCSPQVGAEPSVAVEEVEASRAPAETPTFRLGCKYSLSKSTQTPLTFHAYKFSSSCRKCANKDIDSKIYKFHH